MAIEGARKLDNAVDANTEQEDHPDGDDIKPFRLIPPSVPVISISGDSKTLASACEERIYLWNIDPKLERSRARVEARDAQERERS